MKQVIFNFANIFLVQLTSQILIIYLFNLFGRINLQKIKAEGL